MHRAFILAANMLRKVSQLDQQQAQEGSTSWLWGNKGQ